MVLRVFKCIFIFFLCLSATGFRKVALQAQSTEELKKAVVRISARTEGKHKEGTGFVVQVKPDAAYVVTASHVIEGDREPRVTFFAEPTRQFPARVIGLEGNDPRGVALLEVTEGIPADLLALHLDTSTRLTGGDAATLIGFPRVSRTAWAVTQGTFAGQAGRDLTFTAPADEGNSGGPVIKDGKVIGVVTEVAGQFCTAAPAILVRLTLEGWGVSLQQPPQAAVKEKPVQNAKATELLKTAQLQSENGDFRNAWRLVEQAAEIEPNAEMLRWQAELAMKWLRRLVIKEGETFGAVVDRVQGTLYRGATGDDPSLAADCFAHIGWGNFLKGRDGSQRLEVEGNYRKAVELDPSNSYAHAMWGHWILWKDHERLEEARPHFATALKSGRDREFVRNLQLAALKNARSGNASAEIIRVADEIRRNNEPLGLTERSQIESHVYFMYRNEVLQQLSSILPPSDHLATYQWLIRGLDQIHLRHEFWVARLTEATGNLRQALAEYRSIRTRSQTQGLTMGQELDEAIRRCEAAKH